MNNSEIFKTAHLLKREGLVPEFREALIRSFWAAQIREGRRTRFSYRTAFGTLKHAISGKVPGNYVPKGERKANPRVVVYWDAEADHFLSFRIDRLITYKMAKQKSKKFVEEGILFHDNVIGGLEVTRPFEELARAFLGSESDKMHLEGWPFERAFLRFLGFEFYPKDGARFFGAIPEEDFLKLWRVTEEIRKGGGK